MIDNNREQSTKPVTPREIVERRKEKGLQAFPGTQHWIDLQGSIRTVTTTPTLAPKSISDSLLIYVDSLTSPTTKRLYIYSREADTWLYVALT